MYKVLLSLFVLLLCIFCFNSIVFADSAQPLYADELESNSPELLTLTNPEGKENVIYSFTFTVSGRAEAGTDVRFMVYADDRWIDLEDIEGKYSFTVGESGIFTREFGLPGKGTYRIRVVAINGERVCVEERTMIAMDENVKEAIKSDRTITITEIMDGINNILNSKKGSGKDLFISE